MLTLEDINLIERDANMPQLRTLIDRECYTKLVSKAVPESDVSNILLTYLRYKPGMNCIAGYEYRSNDQTKFCYTKIFATGQQDKKRKFVNKVGATEVDGVHFAFFPQDSRLKSLNRIDGGALEQRLLARMFKSSAELQSGSILPIRYKPERRYVGRLVVDGENRAVVKMHTLQSYAVLKDNNEAFQSIDNLKIAGRLGYSNRHNVLAHEWLKGDLLSDDVRAGTIAPERLMGVGQALARIHAQEAEGLPAFTPVMEAAQVAAIADQFVALWPAYAAEVHRLSRQIGAMLVEAPVVTTPIHGDFYAKQVLLDGDQVGILDFDESALGDPMTDVGNFIAHLARDQSRFALTEAQAQDYREAFVEGYASVGRSIDSNRIALLQAANLFKLIPHPFRFREPNWPAQTRLLMDRVTQALLLAQRETFYVSGDGVGKSSPAASVENLKVTPAPIDPAMPFLNDALEAETARGPIAAAVESVLAGSRVLSISHIKLLRHKMGRRALVSYGLEIQTPGGEIQLLHVLGKARSKKVKQANYDIMASLRDGAFGSQCGDGIHVPAPLGIVPAFNMWLQQKVEGATVTNYLDTPASELMGIEVARALHKLNTKGPATEKVHTIEDELGILETRLQQAAAGFPHWKSRIEKVLAACKTLAAMLPETPPAPIHRDFYPDNVLVGKDSLYLLDLDLYCMGAPSLDAGNFIGHVIEYSLRKFNDASRLSVFAEAFENAYVDLIGERQRKAVAIYTTLTLARHIQISTLFEDRKAFTPDILALCEQRLATHFVTTITSLASSCPL